MTSSPVKKTGDAGVNAGDSEHTPCDAPKDAHSDALNTPEAPHALDSPNTPNPPYTPDPLTPPKPPATPVQPTTTKKQPATPEKQPATPEKLPATPMQPTTPKQRAAPRHQPAAPKHQPAAPKKRAAPKHQRAAPKHQRAAPKHHPTTPKQRVTRKKPASSDSDADLSSASVDLSSDEDTDPDWSEPENFSESDSDSEEGAEIFYPPPRTLSQLLDDFFVEEREYAPLELAPLLQEVSVRDVRPRGVHILRQSIEKSGWVQSSLMIAHDRQDGRPPVLLEGGHRAKALIQVYRSGDVTWPIKNLKVKVKILKGLSPSEEKQIGRESNHIHSNNVSMSLVDQVVAMWYALQTCREQGNFSPEQRKIPMPYLLHLHPDYNDRSSVRRWKQLAEGFGKEAMEYLRDVHKESAYVGLSEVGLVHNAFSTKTLADSHVTTVLEKHPGAQLWYLKRIVDLESTGRLKDHDANWCEELAHQLKSIADLCEDFADFVDRKCPRFSRFGRALRNMVHTGEPRTDPELRRSVAREQLAMFDEFAEVYLYQPTKDEEWIEACQLHARDDRFYSNGLKDLLASTCFRGESTDVEKALGFSRDVFFAQGPPGSVNVVEDDFTDIEEPPRKKRKTKKKSQKQKGGPTEPPEQERTRDDIQEVQEDVENAEDEGAEENLEEIPAQTPEEEQEVTRQVSKNFKKTSFEVRIKYRSSKKDLPEEVFNLVRKALEEGNFSLENGEEVKAVRTK